MNIEEKSRLNSQQLQCYWCHNPMTSYNSFEETVCLNCYRKLTSVGLSDKEIFEHEILIFSKIKKKDAVSEAFINRRLEEIAKNYLIPSEIKPILKNVLAVSIDTENSFSEAEREVLPYLKIKSSIDSHIAKILRLCRKK